MTAEWSAWVVPLGTGIIAAVGSAFATWLSFVKQRQDADVKRKEFEVAREESLEKVTERLTLAQLERMQRDIEALRSRVTECEEEIRRCEATIREMQTRGHKWYRWAHELMGHTLDARARATPPPGGWPDLPQMPNKFDLDDIDT
jgi:hypothetical protein